MRRLRTVFALELSRTYRRPLFWVLAFLVVIVAWLFSHGNLRISTGDSSVGGTKAWITSEFNFGFLMSLLVTLIYSFFTSIASGMTLIDDDEVKVSELLHSTPLRPGEYVWGKFLAVLCGLLSVIAVHVLFSMFFNHLVPNAQTAEMRGPFHAVNYLRPVAVFVLPALFFYAGIAFFLGERTRRPMVVFFFPVLVLLALAFFVWQWTPSWLDPRINRALMLIDPSGVRWLSETWLKQDRGATFYNTTPIGLDTPFVASRLGFLALGLLGVALAQRDLGRSLRRSRGPAIRRKRRAAAAERVDSGLEVRLAVPPRLAELGMASRPPGLLGNSLAIARAELRSLFSGAGLYICVALILLQTIGTGLTSLGPFQTEALLTPGLLAASTMNTLCLCLTLLLLFYSALSFERDRATQLAPILYASPTRAPAILLGKALANAALAVVVTGGVFAGCVIALLVQGTVAPNPVPFLLVWGLLIPTFLAWSAFVLAVQATLRNLYATVAIGLGVLVLTGLLQATNHMNWVGNWMVWSVVRWSDIGLFELDRHALLLSRLFALGLTACFIAIAAAAVSRREADAIGTLNRLRPRSLGRRLLAFSPVAALALVPGLLLWLAVQQGFEGDEFKKKEKDYWKQNLATWKDAPEPAIAGIDLDVTLSPERRSFHTRGSYVVRNERATALSRFALSGAPFWRDVRWTLDGKPYKPEDRTDLYVITPPTPLARDASLRVGFDFSGTFPVGITNNGGAGMEFILPESVVLTSFSSIFTPLIGYDEQRGVENENRYEPKVYAADFYKAKKDAAFGSNSPFPTRLRITVPAAYTVNSVGTLVSESVAGGKRTAVWQSDHPVRFFNIIAGRWQVRRGTGTAIYYYPGHPYNIDAMSKALDAARRYYSEWFYPFPWRELKLSEFSGISSYAQGFPTDISFSENIGFLTKSDVKTDAVFLVTAHESAHQWWGNILTPGKGPGGDILSEGMSHFSTILLFDQVKGQAERIEFCKRIEEDYNDRRRVDAERPLVWIDGSRDGDTPVIYDKGGWVAWMMLNLMGRERTLAGLHHFFETWADSADHPVLQNFTASMRPFAPDAAAYDAFVQQWFHQVVLPEYQFRDARKRRTGGGWEMTARLKNAGTGRMPVEVAAATGDRFDDKGKPQAGYREARATVVLGAGEERLVTIACPFEPKQLVADPDARVLQLRRKFALAKL